MFSGYIQFYGHYKIKVNCEDFNTSLTRLLFYFSRDSTVLVIVRCFPLLSLLFNIKHVLDFAYQREDMHVSSMAAIIVYSEEVIKLVCTYKQ